MNRDNDLNVREHSGDLEGRVTIALKEIDLLKKERTVVKTADELESLERKIVAATNKLASALIAQKLQDSIDSVELKGDVVALVKSDPKRVKNQGIRDVTIRPLRGEPFTVKATYFNQKGKGKKNG